MRPSRTSLLALPLAALTLALAAAGCGGSQVAADEVPGNPPVLQVPTDADLGATGSNASGSTSADEESDSSGADSSTADTGTSSGGTTTAPQAATATPEPQATSAPNDTTGGTQPPPGSPPEQFEDFCEQNAGAC